MRIDIWSDLVCPWCYLGATRLDAALDQIGREGIDVHWRAFQLDPNAPAEPRDLRKVLESKYGAGAFDTMTERLVHLGHEAGIEYRFDRAQSINTADAHRLVAWAGADAGSEAQGRLVRRMFRGYFTDGEDLSSRTALLDAVADADIDLPGADAVLDGVEYADEVRQDQRLAQERGISGVPAFVIDDQWLIPGAQDVDRLVQMLERARENDSASR